MHPPIHLNSPIQYLIFAVQFLLLPLVFLVRAFQSYRDGRNKTGVRLRVSHYTVISFVLMAVTAFLGLLSTANVPTSTRLAMFSVIAALVVVALYLPIKGYFELRQHEKSLRHKSMVAGPGVSIRNSRLKGKKVKSGH